MKFISHILPKSLKIPDLRTFIYTEGLTSDILKSYLVTISVADRIFGIECFISDGKFEPYFIAETHKIELPIKPIEQKLILREYGESESYYLQSTKSSVFPFAMDHSPLHTLTTIKDFMKSEELIIGQILCIKKHAEFHWEKLWEQYIDYLNGIEHPTNMKIIRSLQHKLLDFQKKMEGGYRRNPRIDETEKKLTQDVFQVEVRFMVFGSNRESRRKLAKLVHSHIKKLDYVNSWNLIEYHGKQDFFADLQLRRPSFLLPKQILCVSELVNLLSFNNEEHKVLEVVQEEIGTPELIHSVEEDKNNPFSIFPRGTKKHRENDIHFVNRLNRALRKLKLSDTNVVIQKFVHGPTLQKVTFNLPNGLTLTNLIKSVPNIQTELALSSISFEQGEEAGTVRMVIPQDEREFIYVRDCVESLRFQRGMKNIELPIILGVDTEGEVILVCLTMIKHLLIAGSTGNGKSVLINSILCVLFAIVNPKLLRAYMIDPKKVELNGYKDYPHVQDVYTDMDKAEGLLCFLCEEMQKRYELFQKKGCKNIQQYNQNEKEKLLYQLIVIDELADLIMTHPEVENHIVRLAQMGRAAGFHLIIATQKPYEHVITGLIKTNIYSRACFLCDAGSSYKVALDETLKFPLLGKGDGAYRFEGMQGLGRFQGAKIGRTDNEDDEIVKKLATYWKENIKKDVIDLKTEQERKWNEDMKKIKKIVLETGETRMMELQKILGIRNDRVKSLMEELATIGWVKQHQSKRKGYELLLNDEQRRQELDKLK